MDRELRDLAEEVGGEELEVSVEEAEALLEEAPRPQSKSIGSTKAWW